MAPNLLGLNVLNAKKPYRLILGDVTIWYCWLEQKGELTNLKMKMKMRAYFNWGLASCTVKQSNINNHVTDCSGYLVDVIIFSCYQAALRTPLSVGPSVRLSVCPSVCLSVTPFFTLFLQSYYHWQKWCPCKGSRSEVKGQGHKGQNPI